ncbi:hypothetical protein L7F22_044021 [Adiantum nelumboides]|nr:hypothetical protein [Adiantum nelumboides]
MSLRTPLGRCVARIGRCKAGPSRSQEIIQRRLLHVSSRCGAAEATPAVETGSSSNASTSASAYPFSSSVITRNHATAETSSAVAKAQPQMGLTKSGKERKNRGIMAALHAQLRSQYDQDGSLTALFARNSRDRVPPGSIVIVESWNDMSKTTFTSFSGALIAIRRRGTSTSFVLRNLVNKTGVEMRFNLYSPLIKEIKVVQRAVGSKRDSRLRRARRAKLYYVRRDDSRLPNIARAIQLMRERELQARNKEADVDVSSKAKRTNNADGKRRK